jgi:predicted O-linked N-acetylglucosamine transferase (SPINDLY family)
MKEDALRKYDSPSEKNEQYNPFNMTSDERLQTTIYFIPQDPIKLHNTMNSVIENILQQDTTSVVCLLYPRDRSEVIYHRFKGNTTKSDDDKEYVFQGASSFSSNKYGDRIVLLPRTSSRYEFRHLISLVDVVLDPWPWGGWTTSIQALCSNVPVITLPGGDARSRFTYGLYEELNMMSFVAKNVTDYVHLAINTGKNKNFISKNLNLSRNCLKLLENRKTKIIWKNFINRAVQISRQ